MKEGEAAWNISKNITCGSDSPGFKSWLYHLLSDLSSYLSFWACFTVIKIGKKKLPTLKNSVRLNKITQRNAWHWNCLIRSTQPLTQMLRTVLTYLTSVPETEPGSSEELQAMHIINKLCWAELSNRRHQWQTEGTLGDADTFWRAFSLTTVLSGKAFCSPVSCPHLQTVLWDRRTSY